MIILGKPRNIHSAAGVLIAKLAKAITLSPHRLGPAQKLLDEAAEFDDTAPPFNRLEASMTYRPHNQWKDRNALSQGSERILLEDIE